jgi:hypothetical protein
MLALLFAVAADGCAAQNAYYPPWPPPPSRADEAAPNAAEPGAPPNPRLVPPAQEGATNATTAVEAPLHELNLVRERIPPVLLAAMADPYADPRPLSCRSLSEAIDTLTVALGPDFDNPPPPSHPGVTGSGGLGLKLMNSAAGGLLPFHGYVGTLSGAAKHDELINRAIEAGAVQRAYYKGLGEAYDCRFPARPRHLRTRIAPVYDGPRRPDYPIWPPGAVAREYPPEPPQ